MKKEVICGIYKITSPSNNIYIGESKNIYRRWKSYKNLLNCKNQTILYRSFNKYGVENHFFEIIEECKFEELWRRERYWQDFYDVTGKKGLNVRLTKTDKIKGVLGEETKKKLSDYHKQFRINGGGNPPPPPLIGKENPMYGKKHTKESIEKMIKNKKILKGEEHYNSSIFLDLETGIYYFSVREVAEILNKSYNYIADRVYGKVKVNNLRIVKV